MNMFSDTRGCTCTRCTLVGSVPLKVKKISNAQELTMQLSQTLSSAVAQIKSFKQPNYKSHNKDHAPAPSFPAFILYIYIYIYIFFFFFFYFLPLAAVVVVEERF